MIAVVPRFIARLRLPGPPVGPVWDGTWLELPAWASRAYRNVLTGERVEVATREGRPVLPLEAVLATFPLALLDARTNGEPIARGRRRPALTGGNPWQGARQAFTSPKKRWRR